MLKVVDNEASRYAASPTASTRPPARRRRHSLGTPWTRGGCSRGTTALCARPETNAAAERPRRRRLPARLDGRAGRHGVGQGPPVRDATLVRGGWGDALSHHRHRDVGGAERRAAAGGGAPPDRRAADAPG